MTRIYLLGSLLLALALAASGLVYAYQSAMETAFRRGHAAGAAETGLQLARQWDEERRASAGILANANRQVSRLEQDRAEMETRYAKLSDAAPVARGTPHACLDARLVQLLNAVGAGAIKPAASP